MLKRTFLSAAGAAALALILAPSAIAQAPKLRIGVEGNYPPFSMIAPDGKLGGFDIDIANAICAEMKAECVFVQQEFDGMIPALNAKKFDMIVASMTITEARKKSVNFSDPYYDVPSRFVAKTGAFADHSPASLKGKKIVVLRNSPRAAYLAENYKGSEIVLAGKETEVYMELAVGRADVAFGSSVVSAEAFLKKPEGKGFAQLGPAIRIGAGSGVGIAVRKDDEALRTRINAALAALKSSGRYKALADKYFDFDISGS
ncbi:transporter substrate-binding domain-containing protein [Rhabdaerophilum sp. SD176]|uniref:transporter substrate-binding domain-containing protein n=1 Tax=Rhabdaerophilum sp. SD176 TaxID=2983548 RepID=UPI0024E011C4|nr:transporter substrate-binding domain-containing protein [Rhabdaerophilum sp. SD176]